MNIYIETVHGMYMNKAPPAVFIWIPEIMRMKGKMIIAGKILSVVFGMDFGTSGGVSAIDNAAHEARGARSS